MPKDNGATTLIFWRKMISNLDYSTSQTLPLVKNKDTSTLNYPWARLVSTPESPIYHSWKKALGGSLHQITKSTRKVRKSGSTNQGFNARERYEGEGKSLHQQLCTHRSGEQPVHTGADHRSLWKGLFQKDETDTILHVFKHIKRFTQGEFGN